jgi:hypothetical protein
MEVRSPPPGYRGPATSDPPQGSQSNPTLNSRTSVRLQLPHIKAPKRIALPQGLQRLGSVLPAFLDFVATPHQPCHRFFMLGDGECFSLADTFQEFGEFGLCLESAHDRSYRLHLFRLVDQTGSSSLRPIGDPLCGGPFGTYRGPRASRFTPRHNRSMRTLSSQSPPSIHAHPHVSTLQHTRPNSAGELAALIRVRASRGGQAPDERCRWNAECKSALPSLMKRTCCGGEIGGNPR